MKELLKEPFKKIFRKTLKRVTYWQGGRVIRSFEKAAQNYAATQSWVLLKKIKAAEKSEWGRRFQFDQIKSIEDFRRRVPLLTYEDLAPMIDRVVAGEVGALFHPREKIQMFALSSGTTDHPPTIPVTRDFLNQYRRGSLLWGFRAAMDHPEFVDGKILPIVSPACEEKTPLGVPCGAISGLIAQTQKYLARSLYPVPSAAYEIAEVETRDYVVLRFALPEKITLLTSANPSTLVRLAHAAAKNRESLIRDLRDGTLRPPGETGSWRVPASWKHRLRPNRTAARRLEQLSSEGKPFTPQHFWPHLVLIACWKGGTLSTYLPSVHELYGNVPIRDLGLLASEGRMTIPLSDEGSGGVLDLQSHFFEFLPEEKEDLEPGTPTLLGNELEIGKKYFILLTTSSGLYRYHIHDLVQVESFFYQTPVLRFLNKGKYFSSLTGEKLSEFQVVQAVERASSEQGLKLQRFLLTPCWGDPPNYVLLLEKNNSVAHAVWERLQTEVEHQLQKLNSEYCSKRKSARLNPVEIQFVPRGRFQEWDRAELANRTGRFEQYKPRFLSNDLSLLKDFVIIKS